MENLSSTALILRAAKSAVKEISSLSDEKINEALLNIAKELEDSKDEILKANENDVNAARGTVSEAMIDRLTLTRERISGMADGIRQIAALPSPLGMVLERNVRPNGLVIEKISVAMGVIAVIYESRPNVTSDAAALALKSGSVSVLRGGKEAYNSSFAIVSAMRRALKESGITENAVNLISDTTRTSAHEIMKASGYIDLLIPRGGAGLIRACVENSTVPCLETGTGICHVYVDKYADLTKAISIIDNAKTSRPSVCNAAEVCLVHKDIANEFLPKLYETLVTKRKNNGNTPVKLKLCPTSCQIINGEAANECDFDTEFLDYVLAVRVVDSCEEAISHILTHSTHHSEAIVSEDPDTQKLFASAIDSAAVYINASTRFTDGGEFGLGCEMGISTQKLHARGPVGIKELTTYKYVITGNGQIR